MRLLCDIPMEDSAHEKRRNKRRNRVRSADYYENNRASNRKRYHTKYKHQPNHKKNAYRYTIRTQYKLSEDAYNTLFDNQNGCCLICSDILYNPFRNNNGTCPHVDHCHATSKVRGLLCLKCNLGLGSFRDNKELLLKAAKYLENSS